VPDGTPDLADIKRTREEALSDAEEAEYDARCDRLRAVMVELFSVDELQTATIVALLDVLEAGGIDRLTTITDIEKHLPLLRWGAGLILKKEI